VCTTEAAHNPRSQVQTLPRHSEGVRNGAFRMMRPGMTGRSGPVASAPPLTTRVPWVNLRAIFSVFYPVASMSRAPSNAARDRPPKVVRNG
jgi:hypothetical protein